MISFIPESKSNRNTFLLISIYWPTPRILSNCPGAWFAQLLGPHQPVSSANVPGRLPSSTCNVEEGIGILWFNFFSQSELVAFFFTNSCSEESSIALSSLPHFSFRLKLLIFLHLGFTGFWLHSMASIVSWSCSCPLRRPR